MTVRTMFLGTSTVLVTDGTSSILVDGFFTRPGMKELFGPSIRPSRQRIVNTLRRAGIDRLDLVVVSHSHADHALDSPLVAELTGARLAGSESTRMIAVGYDMAVDGFEVLDPGHPIRVGAFAVTPITALHSAGDAFPGEITEPLTIPSNVADYKTGGCFSFHFDHPDGRVMINPTANFIAGSLGSYPSDLLYLGAGAAGAQDEAWRNHYWDESVVATGARTVLPVHWDRFWRPLTKPLIPLPKAIDDLASTLSTWRPRAAAEVVDLRMPALWESETVRRA